MGPNPTTSESPQGLDTTWVEVSAGTKVQREQPPQRLLRVSGHAGPGDLVAMSFWLGDLTYTAIALATGQWLTPSWDRIDREQHFDEDEDEMRDWIAIQVPIPNDSAFDARALNDTMQILGALATMNRPDGHTLESRSKAPSEPTLLRARIAKREPFEVPDEAGPSADLIVCEAPMGPWRTLAEHSASKGAIPIWGASDANQTVIEHTAQRVRVRLRNTGWELRRNVARKHDGSESVWTPQAMAWCLSPTGTPKTPPTTDNVQALIDEVANER